MVSDRGSALNASEQDFNGWREPILDHIQELLSGDFRQGTNHSRARDRLLALDHLLAGSIVELDSWIPTEDVPSESVAGGIALGGLECGEMTGFRFESEQCMWTSATAKARRANPQPRRSRRRSWRISRVAISMDCAVNGAPIWGAKRLPISRAGS